MTAYFLWFVGVVMISEFFRSLRFLFYMRLDRDEAKRMMKKFNPSVKDKYFYFSFMADENTFLSILQTGLRAGGKF